MKTMLLLFKAEQTYDGIVFNRNCVYEVSKEFGFANRWLKRGAIKVDPASFDGNLSYNELCPKDIVVDNGISQDELDALSSDEEEVIEEVVEAPVIEEPAIEEEIEEVVEAPVIEEPVAKEEKVVENKTKKVRKPRKK